MEEEAAAGVVARAVAAEQEMIRCDHLGADTAAVDRPHARTPHTQHALHSTALHTHQSIAAHV